MSQERGAEQGLHSGLKYARVLICECHHLMLTVSAWGTVVTGDDILSIINTTEIYT
jgi:hypothetical protein